jgi:peptidyl-prolyl cis-trans isomerase C
MFKKPSLVIVLALALAACNQQQTPVGKPMTLNSDTIATVNGVSITQAELDAMIQLRHQSHQIPRAKESLDDLIGMELLRQEAVAAGVHQDPKVAEEINRQATNALVSAYVRKMMESQPITDADLQKEYDARMGELPDKEYKARHILSKTEEEATANIEALKKGADFAKLAKEKSIEPGASTRGGDLGWSTPETFVPEFSAAMTALQPGQFSQEPVQTQFGWHVILLEDVREAEKPDLASVRPQLQRMVANQKLLDHVKSLRENAQIEILAEEAAGGASAPVEPAQPAPAESEEGTTSPEAPTS